MSSEPSPLEMPSMISGPTQQLILFAFLSVESPQLLTTECLQPAPVIKGCLRCVSPQACLPQCTALVVTEQSWSLCCRDPILPLSTRPHGLQVPQHILWPLREGVSKPCLRPSVQSLLAQPLCGIQNFLTQPLLWHPGPTLCVGCPLAFPLQFSFLALG